MESIQSENYELVKYFPLVKIDEQTHKVYGLATCESPDKEGEIADFVGSKKAYQEWSKEASESTTAAGQGISLGNIRYMHKLIIAGKATKIHFDDDRKQVWVEATPAPPLTPEDPDIWPLLRDGYLRGFSHGGKYVTRVCEDCRKSIQGNYCNHCDKRVLVRYTPTIAEISFVDNPALKEAVFTYVKSNGSTELRKFSEVPLSQKIQLNALDSDLAKLVQQSSTKKGLDMSELEKAECKCGCANCKAGKCSSCSAETKCGKASKETEDEENKKAEEKKKKEEAEKAEEKKKKQKEKEDDDKDGKEDEKDADKAVKYLVEKDGEKHLPYTDANGKPNHRLMGAAWAALNGGYRGNKYEGPNKEQAKRKLKQVYAREGMSTPAEKLEEYDGLVKGIIDDRLQSRAFGMMKGMYTVSRFSQIVEDLKYLLLSMEYERDIEQDESPVTDEVKDTLENLVDHLLDYTEEQCEELKEELHAKTA